MNKGEENDNKSQCLKSASKRKLNLLQSSVGVSFTNQEG